MAETHGQICIGRRTGQELLVLDADGAELARVRVTGPRTVLSVSSPVQIQVVRGEVAGRWQPRKPAEVGRDR